MIYNPRAPRSGPPRPGHQNPRATFCQVAQVREVRAD